MVSGQHQDKVDFIRAAVSIEPIPDDKAIVGLVSYQFKVLQDVDSIFLDAHQMEFSKVELNGRTVTYNYDQKRLSIKNRFKKGKEHTLELNYSCTPQQTVYFMGLDDNVKGNEEIWTQGQGKYTSHWVPSFDDMEEKVEFDLNITFDPHYEVIANGKLVDKVYRDTTSTMWSFDMQKPMSSYLLAFVIGNFKKQELKSESGITVENYYHARDSQRVEPTYRYTKEIVDFLEEVIGVPYPWQNYKQVPVKDFLYAGMENTGCTIFSDGYVIDSIAFIDKNYVNVNAHELAHQWFGNLVTEKDGNSHWLHEGFATYYAQLAEKEIFGDDHYYWTLCSTLEELHKMVQKGKGESLLDPKASSLTFYEKGAWALFMLQKEVGEKAFRAGIKSYLNNFRFKNATVQDFIKEMEIANGKDLARFKENWLISTAFPFEEAKIAIIEESPSLKLRSEMEAALEKAQSDDIDYERYWDTTKSVHLKKYIIEQFHRTVPHEVLVKAFASDTIGVRQQLAIYMDSIPAALKADFESLLDDKSYVTVENALLKLWMNYPEEKGKYLERTKYSTGLPNKNVRLLWLTLAILTNDFDSKNTQAYFQELSSYTAPIYGWEIRMGAFQYLNEIGFTDAALKNLLNACEHHSWQFKKYARNLIEQLLKDPDYKSRISAMSEELNEGEKRYIKTKLN